MDGYIARTEGRFAENELKMEAGFLRMEARMALFEAKMERRFSDLHKWSFVFWIGTFTALAALTRLTR